MERVHTRLLQPKRGFGLPTKAICNSAVISTVAEFERDQLVERATAGLARARAQGAKLGRRERLTEKKQLEVIQLLAEGVAVSKLVKDYGTSRQSIMRVREKWRGVA